MSLLGVGWIAAAAGPAAAGEVACRYEAGVITAPSVVAGIAGDYIIDTGAPLTTLDETQAQAAGFDGATAAGDVQLAGARMVARPLRIAPLDIRTWNLPTPAPGVIGADVLKGYVVDVTYAPCRLRLSPPGEAPAFRGEALALGWDAGRPTAEAAVADGAHELVGRFVIATGMNAPMRLADDVAAVPGAARPAELYPDGVWLARLPVVRFGGAVGLDVAAGLMKPDGEVAGALGGQVLANFRLRFDFPAGRLIVAPAR
ncbi:MAG: hypothetical protein JNL41_15680 [Phenylobacterium sp.]|uniref:aspartyl protease family protein n=1 Tax=Phenylobacterium sp. TaxID=1871053 RepID=UPI001A47EE26|nr:aspartyl protease family protein [Phenylobacterium sp.]MBL8555714.1 hypothetical protein [Phenylobacterium sp.]